MIDVRKWLCELPMGWHDLFCDMVIELNRTADALGVKDNYHLIDVKEKYNMMQVYDFMDFESNLNCIPLALTDIIKAYENESKRICPICGRHKTEGEDMFEKCSKRYEEMANYNDMIDDRLP